MDFAATAARIEATNQLIIQGWERIKHDKSPRFTLKPYPGKPQCHHCKKLMDDSKVCSACKVVVYCSPQCIKLGWKTHKSHCPALKRDGEQMPQYKEITNQFPWTDIGYIAAGRFNEDFVLARFGVLGTSRSKVGYWADHSKGVPSDELLDAPWSPLTEEEGWRLPKEFIPTLALQNSNTCPSFPPTFEPNWTSYYEWRRLPISSPAAMLLHWPLSVYACLKELGFLPNNVDCRRKLTVFYVGARQEVSFIPVFGELALLFPNTDLDLVMFGETTGRAVQRAQARGIKKSRRPCVFEYTAPAACGGGTVRVLIDSTPTYYRPSCERSEHPDAIVGLNAGLGSYISWQHVILRSFEFDIPFVITDYCEACFNDTLLGMDTFHRMLTGATLPKPKIPDDIRIRVIAKQVLGEIEVVDVDKVSAALKKERRNKLNGFMQPGLRGTSDYSRLAPGSRNAFIRVLTPMKKAGEVEV